MVTKSKKKSFWVVAYDISDNHRRAKVSKELERIGVRVNFSVFECLLTGVQFEKLQTKLESLIDKREDSIVYYPLCVDCYSKIIYTPRRSCKPEVVKVV